MTIILLAAGLSSRMGCNKLLLPLKGKTVLENTLAVALAVSDRVLVVTGHQKEEIEKTLFPYDVETVFNPDYEKGQRTSTLAGIAVVKDDDFAVMPGDLPLVTEEDMKAVFQGLKVSPTVRGIYKGIPGHPVAYRKENRDRLLAYPGTMKAYLKEAGLFRCPASIGTVFDLDTPERYRALLEMDGDLSVLDRYLD